MARFIDGIWSEVSLKVMTEPFSTAVLQKRLRHHANFTNEHSSDSNKLGCLTKLNISIEPSGSVMAQVNEIDALVGSGFYVRFGQSEIRQ